MDSYDRKILSDNMRDVGSTHYRILLQIKGQYLIENNLVDIWARVRGIDKDKITHSWSDYITLYTAELLGLLDYLKDRPVVTEKKEEVTPLEITRKRGAGGGRKKGLSREAEKKAALAAKLYRSTPTIPISEIMDVLQISKSTLYRYLRHAGVKI